MCAGVHLEQRRRLVLGVVWTFQHLAFDIVIPWAGTLPAEIRRAPSVGWRVECQTPLGGKSGTAEKRIKGYKTQLLREVPVWSCQLFTVVQWDRSQTNSYTIHTCCIIGKYTPQFILRFFLDEWIKEWDYKSFIMLHIMIQPSSDLQLLWH